MGLPISPGVGNLAAEDFEEKGLDSALTKLNVWYLYMDGTFMVLHEYAIQDFTNHINCHSEHIQFTFEAEQGGQLPFLDTLVIVNDDGMLKKRSTANPHTLIST